MSVESCAVSLMKWLDREYHARRSGVVPDNVYDGLRARWEAEFPSNPYWKQVGAPPEGDDKVTLEQVMPHLSKLRPGAAVAWMKSCGASSFIITPKLDGISINLTYDKGKLVLATTRGNGLEGEDVTAHIRLVGNVPHSIPYKKRVIFGGELIVKRSLFKAKHHKNVGGRYKASRNFVGGQLNATLDKSVKTNLRSIDFVCFSVSLTKHTRKPDLLEFARDQSFATVDRLLPPKKAGITTSLVPTERVVVASGLPAESEVVELLKGWKGEIDYDQDGIVVEPISKKEKKALGALHSLHPTHSYAIKLDVNDQTSMLATLDHVEWNMSVRKLYAPVAILKEGREFNGAQVNRASIYNAATVKEWGLGPGAKLRLIRSGDVIPRITKVLKKVKPDIITHCKWCETKLSWTATKNGLYCSNASCEGQTFARLQHFIGCLDIDDISWGVVSKLYEAGITTPLKAVKAKPQTIKKIEGLGDVNSKLFCEGIKKALTNISLAALMYASGRFNTPMLGLGDKRLDVMVNAIGHSKLCKAVVEGNIPEATLKRYKAALMKVKGLGATTVGLFIKTLPSFCKWLKPLLGYLTIAKPAKDVIGPLTGKSFCFTNFRSKEAEQLILSNGGKVEGIKKTTAALFCVGDSKKVQAADAWGVPMYPPDQCLTTIKHMIKAAK